MNNIMNEEEINNKYLFLNKREQINEVVMRSIETIRSENILINIRQNSNEQDIPN